jgi:hypothetical protein
LKIKQLFIVVGEIQQPDLPLVGTNSANKPQPLRLISAVDLRKIEQSISKEDPSKSYQEILYENVIRKKNNLSSHHHHINIYPPCIYFIETQSSHQIAIKDPKLEADDCGTKTR